MKNIRYDETRNEKLYIININKFFILVAFRLLIVFNKLLIIGIDIFPKFNREILNIFLKFDIISQIRIISMNFLNETSFSVGGRKLNENFTDVFYNLQTDCLAVKIYQNLKSVNFTPSSTHAPPFSPVSPPIVQPLESSSSPSRITLFELDKRIDDQTETTVFSHIPTETKSFLCKQYLREIENFDSNQTLITSFKIHSLANIEERTKQQEANQVFDELGDKKLDFEGNIIGEKREQEMEEDELEEELQLKNSFHTIVLENSMAEDSDDNVDDLTVFDMANMENIVNKIDINNYYNRNNNSVNKNSTIYDTSFIPFLNTTSLSSTSTPLLHSVSISPSLPSTQSSSDIFEITANGSLNINFTINNLTEQTITTTINDLNYHYTDQLNWKNLCLLTIFFTFIVITIIGNTLVILAVVTTRRLRTVTNCFVMSLAVADLLVGLFVMPPAVAVHILDSWPLGWVLCDIYISLDVLLCTASILSLCAISVDRYLAVTQPLTYSRKRRSKRLALIMILIVWLLALAITCPPYLGWYEQGRRDLTFCRYNQNSGYVIFSAMGSFFIPMTVMIYVYARISCVVASRHENMTDIINNKKGKKALEPEIEQISSEHDDKGKKKTAARTLSTQTISRDINDDMLACDADNSTRHLNAKSGSSYELIATSRTPSFKRQSTLCNSKNYHQTTNLSSADNKSCVSASSEEHCLSHHHPNYQNTLQQHWANYGRHSVRMHNSTLIISGGNESYITRNTRVQHQKSLSNRITSLNKENKTTQTLSIVVGGFIVCWLPFFLNYIIAPFLNNEQRHPSLDEFLTWLGWFNSAVNPFIYAFYSVDFRAAFWRLTLKRFCKNSAKNQFPSNTMSIRR